MTWNPNKHVEVGHSLDGTKLLYNISQINLTYLKLTRKITIKG